MNASLGRRRFKKKIESFIKVSDFPILKYGLLKEWLPKAARTGGRGTTGD
jgi:hypothetical protein